MPNYIFSYFLVISFFSYVTLRIKNMSGVRRVLNFDTNVCGFVQYFYLFKLLTVSMCQCCIQCRAL
jgi:hypothetical protein